MSVALDPRLQDNIGILSNLIVADVAPWREPIPPEHKGYLQGMREVENAHITSKEEVLKKLEPYEPVIQYAHIYHYD
jgi:hypothetical protein